MHPILVLLVAPGKIDSGGGRQVSGEHGTGQFFVEKVVNLQDARESMRHNAFDLILLDRGIPCQDIATSFDSLWQAASPPVIMATSCPLAPDPGCRRLQVGDHLYFIKGDADEETLIGAIIYSQSRMHMHDEVQHLRDDLQRSHRELESTHLQLIQAEKLEALGQLAAGIAHEVKNPLTRILLGVDYLSNCDFSHDSHRTEVLDEIRAAACCANELIRGMVDFSSASQLNPEFSNLKEIAGNAALMIRHEITSHSIDLHLDLEPALPMIRVDPPKIEQVLVNLFTNAIQAMENGSGRELRLSSKTTRFDAAGHPPPPNFRAGDRAVVAYLDDQGEGIRPEAAGRLFEPFFTTKPQGHGTGLGLTVCRKIIDLHGGHLSLANRPEGGTRVTICLPVCEPAARDEAADI